MPPGGTAGPRSVTTPASSCPNTAGSEAAPPQPPSMQVMSEWQIELARTRTRISLPSGGASRSVSMASGAPKAAADGGADLDCA